MKQFCKEVLNFLKYEYGDAYEFSLELRETMAERQAELKIKSGNYTRIIANCYMQYFYKKYQEKKYLQENCQSEWQEELVNLIENN